MHWTSTLDILLKADDSKWIGTLVANESKIEEEVDNLQMNEGKYSESRNELSTSGYFVDC